MPGKIKESSGLSCYSNNAVWTIEDSGNNDEIYKINFKGTIVKEFEVKNASNTDWEDLTQDQDGNLYIGDFGNNRNSRDDLVIYKLPNPEVEKGDKIDAQKIKFSYPEQKEFPPEKDQLYFDAEAFFHFDGFLYIITRNRSKPFDGKAFVYQIPDKPGKYKAKKMAEIILCANSRTHCQVTSAAISKNGKQVTLLTYTSLWVFDNFKDSKFWEVTPKHIDLGTPTQQESVTYLNEDVVLISDEKNRKKWRQSLFHKYY